MKPQVLFFFWDGVGLGVDDPEINPFALAEMPVLWHLLGERKLAGDIGVIDNGHASVALLDASMGIDGLPQSATGQASLLTGKNVPGLLGYHYGPKPNPEVASIIRQGNLFQSLVAVQKQASLLNAYPQGYFDSITSGRRLYSAIPLAVTASGIPLKTEMDFYAKNAISADLTGEGWRNHLGYLDAPLQSEFEAGKYLASLARRYDLAFFEYWVTDILGHRQEMQNAREVLEKFDCVLEGLLSDWDVETGLILITSDHGNLEDLSTRRHTKNPVPAILIGSPELRKSFKGIEDLSEITPAITNILC